MIYELIEIKDLKMATVISVSLQLYCDYIWKSLLWK